jgi:hypothetical protein
LCISTCRRIEHRQIIQQVARIAWAQGKYMGLSKPVIPLFPISDYGTGAMGAMGACP